MWTFRYRATIAPSRSTRIGRQLGVSEREPDATGLRFLEQRLGLRPRHLSFKPGVDLCGRVELPPWEERREGQLREHDQGTTPPGRLTQEHEEPLDDRLARVGA
jgi:hypothetical protein